MDVLYHFMDGLQSTLKDLANSEVNWKLYVMGFSAAVFVLERYLELRQYPMTKIPEPPSALQAKFTPEVYKKSQAYGKDKLKFSFVTSTYEEVVNLATIYYNFSPWIWVITGSTLAKYGYGEDYEILHSIVYVNSLLFLTALPSLPLGFYKTFVLEEKHGFNKTTLNLYIMDMVKGWVLGGLIGSPFFAAFLWIIKWAGDSFVPWLMTFVVSFQLIMVVVYPLVIQPLFNKLSPLPQDALRTRIEALATRLTFPLKHLYVIDGSKRSSHSNAYFYGLPWSKHIVIYDTLINQSPPEEIEAVLAHELGHWSYSHPLKMMFISQLHFWLILSLFPPFLKSNALLKSFGFPTRVDNSKFHIAVHPFNKPLQDPPVIIAFFLFSAILTPLEAVFSLCMNAVSRRFEWEADRFALELGSESAQVDGDGEKKEKAQGEDDDMGARLGRALITLHVENLSTVWVDWLYSAYHNSHPTLTERLKAMDTYRVTMAKKVQ